jgi:hypothetical protein
MVKKRQTARRPKKARLQQWVCKPCWELKYCPYGPLVEFFPLHPEGQSVSSIADLHKRARNEIAGALRGSELDMLRAVEFFLYSQPDRWKWIKQFETKELGCNVFGHVCPVFFMAEPFTETKEGRRVGRRIPHEVMLKVVRRDGQICQVCHAPVQDDQVEFDHIIPLSKGGPVTAENLRLTCRPCNRKKRDSAKEILFRS